MLHTQVSESSCSRLLYQAGSMGASKRTETPGVRVWQRLVYYLCSCDKPCL
jgi:hypothetical protein